MRDKMITEPQRRSLFAWAKEHGASIDDLREMTPAGSISMMTCVQASALLDRLNRAGPPPKRRRRRPKNVCAMVSDKQRSMIVSLRLTLGWGAEALDDWLSRRHFRDGRAMNAIDSSHDAVAVIELLKGVVKRTERAKEARQRSADGVTAA
jgi:hypothetical protein